MNMQKGKWLANLVLCMLFLIVLFSAAWPVLATEPPLVYVAGNPDAYPVEYYDEESQQYQGLIPELLRAFAASGRYRIAYLDSTAKDNRQELNRNRQVELISGCVAADGFPESQWADGVTILRTAQEGAQQEYRILFTEIADERLRTELSAFFSDVTEAQRSGILLDTAKDDRQTGIALWVLLASCGAVGVLAAVIPLLVAWRCRRREKDVRRRLETDEVTGIGSYEYLRTAYRRLVNDKNRVLYHMIYLQADTDVLRRFYGDREAKELLRYIASVLTARTQQPDILSVLSRGTFCVMKFSVLDEDTAEWTKGVLDTIRDYARRYDTVCPINVCAGIYKMQLPDRDLGSALLKAEYSCAYAQKNGLDFALCTPKILKLQQEENSLQKRIHKALQQEEFAVYLHFFVDASCGKIVGAEALTRWNHPEKGLLMPGQFIPMMEQENCIAKLDFYVLQKVCQTLEELDQQAGSFFISCNMSRNTFASPTFVQDCMDILQQYSFPRAELILELTESDTAKYSEDIYQNALRLKQQGVKIALDDFGNSLLEFYDLGKYHFDGLKLDKGLIANMDTKEGKIILEEIIHMGQRLDMTVLAEGVETKEQVQALLQMNCPVVQGFYFYQPFPIQEAKRIYQEQTSQANE